MTNPLSDENRKTLERVMGKPGAALRYGAEAVNRLMNAVREESAPPVQGDAREAVASAPYDETFNAIGDAVAISGGTGISISVEKFDRSLQSRGYCVVPILSAIRPDPRGEVERACVAEVANEILRAECDTLKAEVEQLRKALDRIAKLRDKVCEPFIDGLSVEIARALLSALEGEGK